MIRLILGVRASFATSKQEISFMCIAGTDGRYNSEQKTQCHLDEMFSVLQFWRNNTNKCVSNNIKAEVESWVRNNYFYLGKILFSQV